MHRVKKLASLLALALLLTAGAAFGQADFSKYVAFGDSLTAGFSSAALLETYQANSYPALLARQFGISGFQQPLVTAPGIGGTPGVGVFTLARLVPTPVIAPTPGQGVPKNLTLPRPYDNLGVPGATVHDLLTTKFGGFHNLVLRNTDPNQAFTALQEGLSLRPTFVTLWIGNNDALGAATAGTDQLLTPLASFEADYRAIAGAIAASGAKMAIATIPDVTTIPFVTTLTRFIINPATGQPVLLGGNPVPLIGTQPGDFVLLSATSAEALGFGIPTALGGNGMPLPGSVVLTAAEAANIRTRVNQYNAVIQAVASERGAALVDANAALTELATTGVDVGGIIYTSAFLKGGVFSYDGVHPTRFGYAFLANLFIDAINAKFGTDVEEVNLFPFVFGQSSAASSSVQVTADDSEAGPPFVFTDEARRSLLTSLSVPKAYIDGTPPVQAPKPKPRGHGGRKG
ncbi:MAG TPA: SGNH/GDSL hydrolase family protein [Thermoanaerobaculia bacterium]|nr:SGNH/GDSL hydrolase family protein [Thermoanaerobaculia bacterium]